MDTTEVGQTTAKLMESLAEEFGDDAQVGIVAVVVEVTEPISAEDWEEAEGRPPTPDDEPLEATSLRWRCSDGRNWVQRGLFRAVAEHA